VQELTAALTAPPPWLAAVPPRRDPADEARGAPVESLQPGPSIDLAPLIARLDTLIARLELAPVAAGGAPFQFPDEAATKAARSALFSTDRARLQVEHRLMTYRQIAERYGRPDQIFVDANGSVNWMYAADDDSNPYQFIFYDGLCR
jgi:hypothetical protein